MTAWRVHDLAPELEVRATGEASALSPELEAEVARHWQAARRDTPGLFNGRVFTADQVEPARILGHWTEYRRVVAQFRDPALAARLRVRSLAVCAALSCADGIVLGQRAPDAVYMAGRWQCVPAGNVEARAARGDTVDLRAQLLEELEEELGIPPGALLECSPVCAIEHPGTRVLDVGFRLRAGLTAAELLAGHAAHGNHELVRLRVVPEAALPSAVADLGESLLPLAPLLLRRAGLLE